MTEKKESIRDKKKKKKKIVTMQIGCTLTPKLCPMKNQIAEIKEKQNRVADLLDLYLKAVENQGRLYHLFADDQANQCLSKTDYKYYLVNRETSEVVFYGDGERLKSYMRLRNIKIDNVMNDVSNFGSL